MTAPRKRRPAPATLRAGSADEVRFGARGTRHGTVTGWTRHQDLGEEPCEACRAAKTEYDARYRTAPRRRRLGRLNARAQARAYGELARRHKAEYAELYAEMRRRVFAEHGEELPAGTPGNPAVRTARAAGGVMLAPGAWRFTDEDGAEAWEVVRRGRTWRAWALPRRPRQPAVVSAPTFTLVRRWLESDAAALALSAHRARRGAPDAGQPETTEETAHGELSPSAEET